MHNALATATAIVAHENPAWKNGAFADALTLYGKVLLRVSAAPLGMLAHDCTM
jgi:hypothetical protein